MIETIAGAAVGLIAGRVSRWVAKRLPPYLFQQWRTEACDVLDLENLPLDSSARPGRTHTLQRGFLPEVVTALLSAYLMTAFGFTFLGAASVSYTHLTLPTIYSV